MICLENNEKHDGNRRTGNENLYGGFVHAIYSGSSLWDFNTGASFFNTAFIRQGLSFVYSCRKVSSQGVDRRTSGGGIKKDGGVMHFAGTPWEEDGKSL